MTDRNLDYDYASKQRVMGHVCYQGHVLHESLVIHEWSASSGVAGEDYVDDQLWLHKRHTNDNVVYGSRGGIDVARFHLDPADSAAGREVSFNGLGYWEAGRNRRISGLFYMDESWYTALAFRAGQDTSKLLLYVENEPGYRDIRTYAVVESPVTHLSSTIENDDVSDLAWTAGWVQFVFEILADGTVRGRAWQPPAADPVEWMFNDEGRYTYPPSFNMLPVRLNLNPNIATTTIDIAWLNNELLPL